MAKLSSVNKNNRRIKLSNKFYKKRKKLKKIIMDKKLPLEERFNAQQKLSKLPRNSSKSSETRWNQVKFSEIKWNQVKSSET